MEPLIYDPSPRQGRRQPSVSQGSEEIGGEVAVLTCSYKLYQCSTLTWIMHNEANAKQNTISFL
jgi:hypothetical protein